MTRRILPPEEYVRLVGTGAESLIQKLTDAARVIVVEQDGQIVGCETFQPVLHGEGLWIHPDYRGRSSVARHLWAGIRETVRECFGVGWFATGADSPQICELLEHVGALKLCEHYMVPVGDR